MRFRVLIYARSPADQPDAVQRAYHQISTELAGTPGLLRNELLAEAGGGNGYIVLSEWADAAAFHAWESGAAHRSTTSPLRPFQDDSRGRPFGLYQVVAAYD